MKWLPRKRTLPVLLMLLVGGAIVNVAVAWGFAWWLPEINLVAEARSPIEFENEGLVVTYWRADLYTAIGSAGYRIMWAHHEIERQHFDDHPSPEDLLPPWLRDQQPSMQFTAHQVSREGLAVMIHGWPCGALAYIYYQSEESIAANDAYDWAVRLGTSEGKPLLFPLRPIWPGFAINTIFYAAILWLLLAFPFKLRRWRRLKRGLCPACAYPVGERQVCTECGKPVRPRQPIASSMG